MINFMHLNRQKDVWWGKYLSASNMIVLGQFQTQLRNRYIFLEKNNSVFYPKHKLLNFLLELLALKYL